MIPEEFCEAASFSEIFGKQHLANYAIYTKCIVGCCLRCLHHSFKDLNGRRVHSFESNIMLLLFLLHSSFIDVAFSKCNTIPLHRTYRSRLHRFLRRSKST